MFKRRECRICAITMKWWRVGIYCGYCKIYHYYPQPGRRASGSFNGLRE